jgi:uncharacterized MAPEG superfamily protein
MSGADRHAQSRPHHPAAAQGGARRAHLNAMESFAPFAALVIVAHLAGKTGGLLVMWATAFFWIRLAHAVVHLLGVPYLPTILFTLGFVCIVGLFVQLIR